MTLAVDPGKIDTFLELARKMDVEATVLGTYTDTGMFHIRYGEETVAYLRMEFLHEGLPQMHLRAAWSRPCHEEPEIPHLPRWARHETNAGAPQHLQQGIGGAPVRS
jgi:phosphoribosylformylglycinamidine synthase